MRLHALALAVLVLMPLAGCLGGAMATAGDLLPQARSLAAAWQPDAALVAAGTLEIKELPPFAQEALDHAGNGTDSPEAMLLRYRDPTPGDGRSGGWMFLFSGAQGSLALVLDASGKELMRHVDEEGVDRMDAIGEVAIDSDAAADLAAKADPAYAALRGEAVLGTVALAEGPHGPVWVLVLLESYAFDGTNAPRTASVLVDATNGTVLPEEALRGAGSPFGGPSGAHPAADRPAHTRVRANHTAVPREAGAVSGSLDAVAPDQDRAFDLDAAGHRELRLQLDLPRALPSTSVRATVTAPDGSRTDLAFTASPMGSAPAAATVAMPQAGHYTVKVHLDAGVLQRYDVAWCAAGSGEDAACAAS